MNRTNFTLADIKAWFSYSPESGALFFTDAWKVKKNRGKEVSRWIRIRGNRYTRRQIAYCLMTGALPKEPPKLKYYGNGLVWSNFILDKAERISYNEA